jgi:hypothetical protein
MADQLREVPDVILHSVNDFLDVVIGENLADDHFGTLHGYFSFGFGIANCWNETRMAEANFGMDRRVTG